MDEQLNSFNSIESTKKLSKTQRFIENTKRAVRKTLTATSMAVSTMGPMATTTTSTIVPASVNTISVVAPVAKAVSLGTAVSLLTACKGDDPDDPIDIRDTTPPTINVNKSQVDITGGKEVRISGNQLYIGNELVASRSDNKTQNCTVLLSINGKTITSGTTISEAGTLTIKVSDEAGNVKSSDIKLNTTAEQPISGLESLKIANMQVDQEIDLLQGITLGAGVSLEKMEIEIDGQKTEIGDPRHYIPAYPGTCNIIITIKDKDGVITEYKVDNITIKPLDYRAMEITNIKPVEILPIIGQVESGDKKCYEHIEHLRIAEATRIRDMMWEYGAGNHNAEEYKQLMMRLNTGMTAEIPKGYDNYEVIGGGNSIEPSDHAHEERHIINTLVNHTNLKIVVYSSNLHKDRDKLLLEEVNSSTNSIYIFGNSSAFETSDKEEYLERSKQDFIDLCKSKNFLLFRAGGNIREKNGILKNKLYHEDIDGDEHGVYTPGSCTNGKSNKNPNIHNILTIGTDADGDIDQTNEIYESSKYPVGFHNNVLFAGRTFPALSSLTGKIGAESGKYATSYTNYVNVAIADLCFQMKADIADVNELLEMIRSTSLTDHIRFNGEDQPLQLMNPAGFFKKYLMPNSLPSSIQTSTTASLNKGYYKGVIFDIPGAEVKINGQWIAYNDANKSQIKGQNPMNLQWRINGDLCKKLGYKGKSVNGKIIVVDDKWNGLNIDKDFSISIQ